MTKQEFFNDVEEIITDNIYIAPTVDEISEEITNNMWSISITQELCNELIEEDFRVFFNDIIENREEQVSGSKYNHGMIFYLWFEYQSGLLRFNLISDFHKELPFKCNLILVDNPQEIVIDFLKYKYHDGIPIIESEEALIESDMDSNGFELKVFKTHLAKC